MDCPICLSAFVFPVQLECEHIFCYLCFKGLVNTSQKCSLCRKSIPGNSLIRPKFVSTGLHSDRPDFIGHQWFYEGIPGRGYWAYDYSTGRVLEEAYSSDHKMCEIVISGVEYCVDFVKQIQYRKDCPSRKRNIRRDLLSNIDNFKGIAGVSKRLVRDISPQRDINSNANSSGQQMSSNLVTNVVNNEDTEEQIRKRTKVEIKGEPIEGPDSTPD